MYSRGARMQHRARAVCNRFCVYAGEQMAAGGPSPRLPRWKMICDHSAIKADRKGTAETVSRLMLRVVSAADFSDRTLTPPPRLAGSTCGSVCERQCGFQKQRPRLLKKRRWIRKKGKRPSHGVYFDIPPLPACSWKKILIRLPRRLWIHPAFTILCKHSNIGRQATIKLDVGVRTCVLIYETCGIGKYEYGWYQVTYRFPRRLHIHGWLFIILVDVFP